MIEGFVTNALEATVSIQVLGTSKQGCEVTAVIDTGFSGDLTLPQTDIDELQLTWLCRQQGMLADGSLHTFDVYMGVIDWNGADRPIEVEVAEIEPLLGMSLLENCSLRIDIKDGGKVVVRPLVE
jgi:clan AA aspartic protease